MAVFTPLPTDWAGTDLAAAKQHAATHDAAQRAINELKALVADTTIRPDALRILRT